MAALSCGDGLGLLVVYIAQPDEDTAAVFGQDSDGGLGLGLDSIIFLLFPVIRQEPNEGKDNLAIYSLTFCETETLMLNAEHSCRHVVCSVCPANFAPIVRSG